MEWPFRVMRFTLIERRQGIVCPGGVSHRALIEVGDEIHGQRYLAADRAFDR